MCAVFAGNFINLRQTSIICCQWLKIVVLVEQKRTGKWLAEQMGKDQATVSKWCTNTSQPDLPTLTKVAEILNVDIKELLNSTKDT